MSHRPAETELFILLNAAASKLDRLCETVEEASDDRLPMIAPELHVSDRAIRAAARHRAHDATPEEVEAFRRWQAAAARLRRTAHRRLEDLDDRIHSLRQCNRALRAYGGLKAHHTAQRLQRKL